MQQTTNFEFNIVEGSDVVNPLTQLNPNFNLLDNFLNEISIRTLTTASASKSGNVFYVYRVRVSNNINYPLAFRFTAPADWSAGDRFSFEGGGVITNVILPDGQPAPDRCFVSGASVIGVLVGSTVTLMCSAKYIPTASEVTTADGGSVQDYIDNTKFKNLETWTPNIGENWETFLARIRDNSTKTIPANFIRCTVDGVSGLIFRQSRRTSATSWQYETDYFTGNSLVKYAMSVGSDSAVLRKYDILNGTVQNLSSADAQIINIYGLDI